MISAAQVPPTMPSMHNWMDVRGWATSSL